MILCRKLSNLLRKIFFKKRQEYIQKKRRIDIQSTSNYHSIHAVLFSFFNQFFLGGEGVQRIWDEGAVYFNFLLTAGLRNLQVFSVGHILYNKMNFLLYMIWNLKYSSCSENSQIWQQRTNHYMYIDKLQCYAPIICQFYMLAHKYLAYITAQCKK